MIARLVGLGTYVLLFVLATMLWAPPNPGEDARVYIRVAGTLK